MPQWKFQICLMLVTLPWDITSDDRIKIFHPASSTAQRDRNPINTGVTRGLNAGFVTNMLCGWYGTNGHCLPKSCYIKPKNILVWLRIHHGNKCNNSHLYLHEYTHSQHIHLYTHTLKTMYTHVFLQVSFCLATACYFPLWTLTKS